MCCSMMSLFLHTIMFAAYTARDKLALQLNLKYYEQDRLS